MNESVKPHPKNAPGPFYVEYGCCTACDVPMNEAPGLFEYDTDNHCFVKRQPHTPDEVTDVIRTVLCAEFRCIRYRGNDADILRRFAELDLGNQCDIHPPANVVPVIRNHVTFTTIMPTTFKSTRQVAQNFYAYLTSLNDEDCREFKFRKVEKSNTDSHFEFAWYEENFHPINFVNVPETESQWLIWYPVLGRVGERGVGAFVHNWLSNSKSIFANIKWYAESDWNGSKRSQSAPW